MKKALKIGIFALSVIVLAAIAILVIRGKKSDDSAPDGPGGVPDFRECMLDGKWTEICESDPGTLEFNLDMLTYKNIWGDSGKIGFEIEENGCGGEVRIRFTGAAPFEYLIFHTEDIDGWEMDVISGIIMEYDGRGPIVDCEFARQKDRDAIPGDYVSSLAHSYNDREPVPSYIMIEELYVEELIDCAGWIGKTQSELEIEDEIITDDGVFRSVVLNGNLIGAYAYGSAYFDGAEEDTDPVIGRISLLSDSLDFETCKAGLTDAFGPCDGEGEIPYAEVNGGAVTWCTFGTDETEIRLSSGSARDYIEITFSSRK